MKKLLAKDRKLRLKLTKLEKQHLILKSIFKNLNFFTLVRWNAFVKLHSLSSNGTKHSLSNRCLLSINKKRFSKVTYFSRHIFLKLIRSGQVTGLRKSSW